MFKLVIADDEGKTFVVPLVRDEISIGRKEGNTIRLTERNVSRKHARLKRANGGFHLEDLSSYNGVKVNGKKIGGETDLKAGDQITIGDYQLALQVEGGDTQPTLPEATAPTMGQPGAEAITTMIAAPGGPPARLVMMSPPNPGQEFALNRASMRLGRAEDLDIWVNHRSISREHAEIKVEGDTYRISDLASANGLRVNGADTRNAELRPGDTIEIGQVRFKFVGPGEHFVFDEGRTMQMDALSLGPEAPNRTPLYIAGGIVGLAIIAGIVVALGSGSGPEEPMVTVVPTGTGTVGGPGPGLTAVVAAAPLPTAADAATAVEACRSSLATGDFDGAAAHANRALGIVPGDPAATECLQTVETLRVESEIFGRVLAARATGDLDVAVMTIEELPPESAYRGRPEVPEIVAQWAEQHVGLAEAAVESDETEANRLAESVLAVAGVPEPLRERAEEVRRRTRSAGRAGSGGGPIRVVSGGSGGRLTGSSGGAPIIIPRSGSSGGSSSGSSGGPATGGGSSSSSGGGSSSSGGGSSSSSGGGSSSSSGGGASEDEGGASLYDSARAAAITGNHREVIRLLNGHCRTQREFELLIGSLRAVPGMESDVVRNMRAYLARFPGTPRASAYQQYLMTHPD